MLASPALPLPAYDALTTISACVRVRAGLSVPLCERRPIVTAWFNRACLRIVQAVLEWLRMISRPETEFR